MQTWLWEELMQGNLDFGKLEDLLWKASLFLFQHLMVEFLESFDKKLMKSRNKARYELKEKNPRTIQTLVGEVRFVRRYYWDRDEERWVYLLDENLKLERGNAIGPGLLRLAVTWAIKGPSYRDARDRLTDLYGAQVLSHEAIRQALLEVGATSEKELHNKVVKEEGQKEVQALFIEVDGFGARMQKNPKKKRRNQRREAKMAVIHEGWEPRNDSKKSGYRLVNQTYICGLSQSEDFWEQVRGVIHAKYRNIDEIPVVINGDGAPWIREGANSFANGMYQYDRFHIAREIRSVLRPEQAKLRQAYKALRKNDMGTLLYVITDAWSNCTDEEQKEKLGELKDLIFDDHEYITDYRVRLRKMGFRVPKDWRGLGAAESNVNKYKNRTAKRGRSWSPEGLQAMLTVLSSFFEGNLKGMLKRTLQEAEEWLLDKVNDGVGHVVKKTTRSQSTGVRSGGFPATRHGTQGYSTLFRSLQNVKLA